jgi:hypothetical protein
VVVCDAGIGEQLPDVLEPFESPVQTRLVLPDRPEEALGIPGALACLREDVGQVGPIETGGDVLAHVGSI